MTKKPLATLTLAVALAVAIALAPNLAAMDAVRVETRTDEAVATFGVSGKGVTVAIIDRGIDWSHPDFVNPDGTTRIRWMLDQSGFNLCAPENPAPVEYSAAQINAALSGGPPLAMRDAVGHGTATAGAAVGNGRALPDRRYRGIAPGADLIVVKVTSEGAPAHDGQPAEAPFQGCIDSALDWVAAKASALGQPLVAIINSGTQWGPIDGTSAVSRKIDQVFGDDTPGQVMVIPSGDEGSLPNHAGADFTGAAETVIGISKASPGFAVMSGWYSGAVPAEVRVTFDDGTAVGPVGPGISGTASGITIINYAPGTEFYPWLSTSGDRALWIGVDGHATTGSVRIRGTTGGTGHLDLYGDVTGPNLTPVVSMTDHLVPGRLNDYASTTSAIVVGDHVIRTHWTDVDGIPRSITDEGAAGELWLKSSAGPTRDGRPYGVDLSAPGQNLFASLGPDAYWATFRSNLPQGSGGLYTRFGGTSGSAPLVVGAVALMLEADPTLTAAEVRAILRATAVADGHTGPVPNAAWGFGKLDVYEAVRAVAQSDCSADGNTACLLGGKFKVEGEMMDFAKPPREFDTTVMSFPGGRAESDQAVFFESFSAGNFETGVKMVNACGLKEGNPLRAYWAFFGGLTNAETQLTILDTVTLQEYEWFNPPGVFPRTLGDTRAFPCADGAQQEACVGDDETACLLGGRFRVTGSMKNFADPPETFPTRVMSFSGDGRAESAQAVFFQSFTPGNFEAGVKMVDACTLPASHPLRAYWVFYGALTNAETRIRVTQRSTGLVDEWFNPSGTFPVSEGRTNAFPCD